MRSSRLLSDYSHKTEIHFKSLFLTHLLLQTLTRKKGSRLFGSRYDLFTEDGERVGQLYPIDTGLILVR
jgi:hypothetical protein